MWVCRNSLFCWNKTNQVSFFSIFREKMLTIIRSDIIYLIIEVRTSSLFYFNNISFYSELTCRILVSPDMTRENLNLDIWMRESLFWWTLMREWWGWGPVLHGNWSSNLFKNLNIRIYYICVLYLWKDQTVAAFNIRFRP